MKISLTEINNGITIVKIGYSNLTVFLGRFLPVVACNHSFTTNTMIKLWLV